MAARKVKRLSTQLPSAPLTEVIFELRWELQPAPPPFGLYDPALIPTVQQFSVEMERMGYHHHQDMGHPTQMAPHSVFRRFSLSSETLFPLMQIGSGIFATNQSVHYEWTSFRAQILNGVRALFIAYPKSRDVPLKPAHLELRYVDVFSKEIIGGGSIYDFARTGTSVAFSLQKVMADKEKFWGAPVGRFFQERPLRERKDSRFGFDLASGQSGETKEEIVQLISKVVSTGNGVPALKSPKLFLPKLREWLDFAHGVTSPFFKSFIKPEVMKKFQRRGS
jgi:uncharacterized protein (TIGR04255 family)